jgi:DNA invertase Pin-like site-specific DNA recombinase
VKLSLGGALFDPTDPMGKMFFNILATFAECEADLLKDAGLEQQRNGQWR